ncbi:ferrochelatase [Dysgonomonas sp. 520]|uniref:ferrochelatase n=1 Tax=Dysgonomonas sp. 520 TaxID=2302931 RepID=UPI0013CFC40C|nr:ferrochelatase [Dysgonomonas sp. 520]NDW08927.1 ferrochelatase [Dysgonomonas sp. 520]
MRGILIVNTGSPRSNHRHDVKEFIGKMLSDPLLLSSVPDWFRSILAKRIIAPVRAFASSAHYSLIWDKENNVPPLLYHTQKLAEKIEQETEMPVEIAMRYCDPSITLAFELLMKKCPTLHEVVVVPMFPQYAQSSYQTVVDEVGRCFFQRDYPFRLKIVEPFYNQYGYIKPLAERIRPFVAEDYERLVFSFHSLPLEHVESGWKKGKDFDYVYQIKETVRLVTKELNIDPNKNRIVYSSSIGKNWLKPDLLETMKELAEEGIKRIVVLTAGFPADNLESLYDIDIEARKVFMEHGGEKFSFVPGLNSEDCWVQGVIKIVTSKK